MVFGLDDMAVAALASGVMSGGSSLLGGMMGASGQGATNAMQQAMFDQQMAFNRHEAKVNRDWQEQMSNTAYQRSMADMRAAGLNPILAAGNGGASSPGGSQGSIGGAPQLGNPGAAMQAGVASAGQAAAVAAQTKVALTQAQKDQSQTDLNKSSDTYTKANTALTEELNRKAAQDTATSAAQQKSAEANASNTNADTINKGIQSMILSHDANTAYQKSRLAQYEADQSQKYGPGTWGNLGGTLEKGVGRVIDQFRQGGGSSLTSPTDPRFWGFRGRDAADPGKGLVIDMRK